MVCKILSPPFTEKHKSLGPTEFLAPHGLAVDSHGDLYVGDVSWTNWPQTFRDKPRPDNLRSSQVPEGGIGPRGQGARN